MSQPESEKPKPIFLDMDAPAGPFPLPPPDFTPPPAETPLPPGFIIATQNRLLAQRGDRIKDLERRLAEKTEENERLKTSREDEKKALGLTGLSYEPDLAEAILTLSAKLTEKTAEGERFRQAGIEVSLIANERQGRINELEAQLATERQLREKAERLAEVGHYAQQNLETTEQECQRLLDEKKAAEQSLEVERQLREKAEAEKTKFFWELGQIDMTIDGMGQIEGAGWSETHKKVAALIEERNAFTQHVGAPSFAEARDVLLRTKQQDEEKIEAMFNAIKETSRKLQVAEHSLATAQSEAAGLRKALENIKSATDLDGNEECYAADDREGAIDYVFTQASNALTTPAQSIAEDTLRMDWLEDSASVYHIEIQRHPDGIHIYSGQPGNIRAAIDVARQEETK